MIQGLGFRVRFGGFMVKIGVLQGYIHRGYSIGVFSNNRESKRKN